MKISLVLLAATTVFVTTACNNASESNTTNSDTSVTNTTSATEHPSASNDSATAHADMMKPMDDMMGKMKSMKMSGDFDVDFANMMIDHHQGALDMAEVEMSKGKDEKLKAKAQEIITKQKKEIQELRDFVSSYKPSGMKHGEGELQKSMSASMDKMKGMQMSGDIDKDFAMMMTHHHEDGISMAKMEVKNGMSDKLKQVAKNIISDQQKEIAEFKSWTNSHK